MSIAYTENFNWPLLDNGGGNWGAVLNGVLTDLDYMLSLEPMTDADTPDLLFDEYGDIILG